MKKNRRILFYNYVMVLGLSLFTMNQGHASATKVGNGDDGADLEVLKPITSGPIVEARQRAIETVKQLNVVGIPGMGLLIPELERSDLMMAAKDVHPTGEQQGSLEISADKGFVYARTFAEPYAATRFFPVAETLTSEQLVALHIHEALHRALPSDIRTDENKVMHLTMAMTSPGASYDRVQQVASLYMGPMQKKESQYYAAEIKTAVSAPPVALPEKSRTEFTYSLEVYNDMSFLYSGNVFSGLELETSLGGYRSIGSLALEPVFRGRIKIYQQYNDKFGLGVSSYDLEGRASVDDQTVAGPFIRFTAKSLDESFYSSNERDLITVGGFYRNHGNDGYFESTLFYSMGSSGGVDTYAIKYNPVLSLTGRTGLKWGRFIMGALFDLHASEGREISEAEQLEEQMDYGYVYGATPGKTRSPFRILAAGPEIGFEGKSGHFKIFAKRILNDTTATFDDLGDIMDRGAGQMITGMSLSMAF